MSGALIDDGAIPAGEYRLRYLEYGTRVSWGVPRVVVRFSVLDFGEHFETELERWYRVASIKGKPRKFGDFKVGKRSALYREYCQLFGGVRRGDRLSFAGLKDRIVVAKVRTVTEDQHQNKLAEGAHYSVIDELLRLD